MLIDKTRLTFAPRLERAFDVIRAETDELPESAWLRWPQVDATHERRPWEVVPLRLVDAPPPGIAAQVPASRRAMPRTWDALKGLPGLFQAAMSRTGPGCHVLPHVDKTTPGVLRAHLGVVVPQGSVLRVVGQTTTWTEGEVLAFDGRLEHETANLSNRPRVILIADFHVGAWIDAELERAMAYATRAAAAATGDAGSSAAR